MNDIEKAKNNLKITVALLYEDKCISESDKKDFKLAISALEKQISKKVIRKGLIKYCPSCKNGNVTSEFCPYCGQKLDWSEVQE